MTINWKKVDALFNELHSNTPHTMSLICAEQLGWEHEALVLKMEGASEQCDAEFWLVNFIALDWIDEAGNPSIQYGLTVEGYNWLLHDVLLRSRDTQSPPFQPVFGVGSFEDEWGPNALMH